MKKKENTVAWYEVKKSLQLVKGRNRYKTEKCGDKANMLTVKLLNASDNMTSCLITLELTILSHMLVTIR